MNSNIPNIFKRPDFYPSSHMPFFSLKKEKHTLQMEVKYVHICNYNNYDYYNFYI